MAKHYGDVRAVDDVSIDVGREEFLTLLGASGSGKTTLLMTVAGFTMPDRGRIVLDGEDITWLPPSLRNIGVVFQSYALFPHMTVSENVAYPLRVRKVPRRESEERTERALELVQLGGFGERMPSPVERRPAAAGGARPGGGVRAASAAHGRTPRRAGQEAARVHAARDQRAPAPAQDHGDLRHPRPVRGAGPCPTGSPS